MIVLIHYLPFLGILFFQIQKATLVEQEPMAAVLSRAPRGDIEKDVGLVAPAESALASPRAHALPMPARRASHRPPASSRRELGLRCCALRTSCLLAWSACQCCGSARR